MGFSVAIIAFQLEDAPRVLEHFDWRVTEVQVGQAVDPTDVSWEQLMSPEHQALTNPHFSAARSDDYFFVYVSLEELGLFVNPDYATLSTHASLTVHSVVETSNASSIEFWEAGERKWSVGGASGMDYEVIGDAPIDLDAQATAYRDWWNNLSHYREFDLPEANADLIVAQFSSLTGDYFAQTFGFRYNGDHPPLYRLEGELPTVDTRR